MESQTTSAPPNVGQSAFFYYNPEPAADQRQHGHFSPHPKVVREGSGMHQYQQQWMHHQTMLYGQPHAMYPQVPSVPSMPQKSVLATPRPMQQKPTFLYQQDGQPLAVDTDCTTTDLGLYPSTPALSVSGSAASSPPSTCGILPTPISGSYSLESMEGVKEGCHGEVKSEILAGGDFSRCDTPPLTPVFIHPPSVTASQASDLLSINSCPSLSPSPSPVSQASSVAIETKFDFCDPRNLLVDSHNSVAQVAIPEFPTLPTLCSGDDEEHKLMLGGELGLIKQDAPFKFFDPSVHSTFAGLPNFDTFSDLDSENDFVTDLTRFPPTEGIQYLGEKGHRLDLISFDEEEFLSEDSFDDFEDGDQFASPTLITPPESRRSSEDESNNMRPAKKRAGSKKQVNNDDDVSDVDDSDLNARSHANDSSPDGTSATQETSAQTSATASSDGNLAASSNTSATPSSQATARRGRKQSLTDDPSKTFVCDICSRRFRRQEHLKRHHRSLHTHDKPFECNECGKTFSRSDNLSQHARTHGSGAIIMGVLDEGELPPTGSEPLDSADTGVLGTVLFEAAQAAAAKDSSSSSGSISDRDSASPAPSENSKPAKKRKRED